MSQQHFRVKTLGSSVATSISTQAPAAALGSVPLPEPLVDRGERGAGSSIASITLEKHRGQQSNFCECAVAEGPGAETFSSVQYRNTMG